MSLPPRCPSQASLIEFLETDEDLRMVDKRIMWMFADGIMLYNHPKNRKQMVRMMEEGEEGIFDVSNLPHSRSSVADVNIVLRTTISTIQTKEDYLVY